MKEKNDVCRKTLRGEMQLETVRKYQKIVFHKKQTSLLNVY